MSAPLPVASDSRTGGAVNGPGRGGWSALGLDRGFAPGAIDHVPQLTFGAETGQLVHFVAAD